MGKKILIAEDDKISRSILKEVLHGAGHEVIEAENGKVAWSIFRENKIDLLITDWVMPELDGLELVKLIRDLELDYYVYIIMLTGNNDKHHSLLGFKAGIDDYITKPFNSEEVIARIRAGCRIVELEDKYKDTNYTLQKRNQALEALHSELSQAAIETRRSYAELKQVFNLSYDGVWVVDREHNIIRINDRFMALTGLSKEKIIGRKCYDVLPCKNCDTPMCSLDRIYSGEERFDSEISLDIGERGPAPFIISATAITDASGQISGTLMNLRDITILKKAQSLQEEKIKAEARDAAKSDFLANMSHEIRTPLNGIIGVTEIALESAVESKQKDFLKSIRTEGESLLKLVNDILDFSKIESGKLELDKSCFNLNVLIADISGIFASSAEKKDISFDSSIPADIPANLVGDAGKLKQIINNLLNNALKFTHKGGISFNVSIADTREGAVTLKFSIADTGIGIPEDRQDKILERFTQADSSTTRGYGGTGLGTTISKQLAELMGGEFGLESKEREGSLFWFTADFDISDKDSETCKEEEFKGIIDYLLSDKGGDSDALVIDCDSIDESFDNIEILLVEDYPTNQMVAMQHLKAAGYNVDLAENGKKAIELLRRKDYDLILMDIQMPEMSGFDATDYIRKLEKENNTWPGIVIIAMTAHAVSGYREICLARGFDDYITKPLIKKKLLSLILSWSKKINSLKSQSGVNKINKFVTGEHRVLPSKHEEISDKNIVFADGEELAAKTDESGSDAVLQPIDFTRALDDFEGDRELLFSVTDSFISNVRNQIDIMCKALGEGNGDIIRGEAHSIKGGAANIYAFELSSLAHELESAGASGKLGMIQEIMDRFEVEVERLDNYIMKNERGTLNENTYN